MKISNIILKKGDYLYLENNFFVVNRGKVLIRYVLDSGKAVTDEYYINRGEIIGNFGKFFNDSKLMLPSVDIEVEALEETNLEKIKFCYEKVKNNIVLRKTFDYLIKSAVIRILEGIYDTRGYMLLVFKFYANKSGEVNKNELKYEYFKIGKSQYYLILSALKKESYLEEKGKTIKLNLNKIDKYLEDYINDVT